MTNIGRREFLRRLALGASALASGWLLNACGAQPTPIPTRQPVPPVPPAPPSPGTTSSPVPAPAATIVSYPDVAIARGGEPEEMVRRALAALGGMERFVQPGADVIVKPNICVAYHTYEYAATTNPWVVAALVGMCLEAGARRVRVMDFPFGGTPEEAYAVSGIQDQVLAAGGEMEVMAAYKFVPTEIQGVDLHSADIYDEILNADVLINVPIAKDHSLARLTLGMKNLMGVIRDRPAIHSNLGQRLADLAGRIRPALTVVDGVRILLANGPTGGSLDDVRQMDTIIASPDIVAADACAAATLFGMHPDTLNYIRSGTEAGLGRSDLENLHIEEITVGG